MIDQYYDDPAIAKEDRVLLALAFYNAGPRRVRELRSEVRDERLDPNRWFDHVAVIAARKRLATATTTATTATTRRSASARAAAGWGGGRRDAG